MTAEVDERRMALALSLAENGLYSATPNPRVGCVVFRGGEVVGRGWHRAAGEAHAEVVALSQAGERAAGGEVYVSLEPCAHVGRTPPCADALIRAKPARVVVAMSDPDPRVCGNGIAKLRAAGIRVDCGVLRREALELNLGFASRMIRGRPWLRIKIAATLDGRTALESGLSRWITGAAARTDAHHFRARSCAVVTGIGTAETDDPLLTVRHVAAKRQPLRVLADRRLRASPKLKMLSDGGGALVACAVPVPKQSPFAPEVEVVSLPDTAKPGGADLRGLLELLAARGVNEATLEAGRKLSGAFLHAGLADELMIYTAPSIFGEGARAMFSIPSPESPGSAPRMELREARPFPDGDIRAIYRKPGVVDELQTQPPVPTLERRDEGL